MVVTVAPSRSFNLTLQLVTARPSTITVHALQSRLSQPYFVPVRLDASRSAHSSGVPPSSLYSTPSPLTVIRAMFATLASALPCCQGETVPRVMTSNGYAIGYQERGGGLLAPIVFLHGVGSDKSVWHPQLGHFGQTRRAVAFDYPGYGGSDRAPDGTARDDYASAILSAMHELGIDRAHVCGLSLGGVIAIAMHHAGPVRCASLILADSFAVHPQGQAIYERSLAGSHDIAAMAEARVDFLLASPADPEVRREAVETMSKIDA